MQDEQTKHWLVRQSTIKWLWIILYCTLAITVLIEVFVEHKSHFGKNSVDGTFGFNAWYGFLSCLLMVVVAKVLGWFIKRKDTYYD